MVALTALRHNESLGRVVDLYGIGRPGSEIRAEILVPFKETVDLGTDSLAGTLDGDRNRNRIAAAFGLELMKSGAAIRQAALDIDDHLGRQRFGKGHTDLVDGRQFNFNIAIIRTAARQR